jgi:molecular chaperone GrpE
MSRTESQQVEEAQHAGEIEQQTLHHTPCNNDPEHGLPVETVESESSGATEAATKGSVNDSINDSENPDGAKKNSDGSRNNHRNDSLDDSSDELAQVQNQLRQLAADFENFKKQAARRESEARERAIKTVLEDLLPVMDNFERALGAATSTADVQSLRTGVEFILQQFQEALKSHGIEPIDSRGETFDPSRHEAIEEIESGQNPGTIVDDLQRGYIYKGQVLRPSRVRVAK